MDRKNIPIVITGILALFFFFSGCGAYNGFVNQEVSVEEAWAKVQSAYQRRADLIPNLVNTVKGVADYEKGTLEAVTKARASATGVTLSADDLTPGKIQQFQEAQSQLSGALSRLLVSVEKYPELKAASSFQELQVQLEGTENRIKVERDRFNEVVADYNRSVRRFPGVIFAGLFGFERKGMFEAESGADKAPEVKF
ncbi:MAG: LemA family protein [Saprospiraceae bacterium]|jgi:LemA protein